MPAFAKPGVSFGGLAPAGHVIKSALDRLADTFQCAVMVTCTTTEHGPTNPHTRGEAMDVRTIGWTPENIARYYQFLKDTLGPQFTVLYEVNRPQTHPKLVKIAYFNPKATASHFHIQVRMGHTYVPDATVKG